MTPAHFNGVDEYLASQSEDAQHVLHSVRNIIRKALPRAEELISYNIPAYKVEGGIALYFAGWKHHYSLYPAGERLRARFKDELAPYRVSKGTIRFSLSEPVPAKLIERIAKFRAKEVTGGENARSKTGQRSPKKRRADVEN